MVVLCASTGFGKTVVAISVIASRKVNTLILAHRKELLEQWIEKLNVFSELDEIGVIGQSKRRLTHIVDVAMIQSLRRMDSSDFDKYGQIIVDECHHIAAYSFESILKKFSSRYIVGLTATPKRKDGLHPIIYMQCGDLISFSSSHFHFTPMYLIKRETSFFSNEKSLKHAQLISEMASNEKRNYMIFEDVIDALERKRYPIILTERLNHVNALATIFSKTCKNLIIIKGGMSKKQRQELKTTLKSIPDGEERLIIATGKYIGEGFDYPILDTLFLTMPISWKGTLQQYVGRLMRNYKNKDSIEVYDYVDVEVPKLTKMYEKRFRAYRSLGFTVEKE